MLGWVTQDVPSQWPLCLPARVLDLCGQGWGSLTEGKPACPRAAPGAIGEPPGCDLVTCVEDPENKLRK